MFDFSPTNVGGDCYSLLFWCHSFKSACKMRSPFGLLLFRVELNVDEMFLGACDSDVEEVIFLLQLPIGESFWVWHVEVGSEDVDCRPF